VNIRLEGYEDWEGQVEVIENEFAELNVALTRSTGDLQVDSNPPGLDVMVTGRDMREPPPARTVRTPTALEGLPTGEYTLAYRRPDWPEQVQTVRVERGTSAAVMAEFVGGSLQVTSTPEGAVVWSQGRRIGTTPLTLSDLPPGNFEFEFHLDNHHHATRSGRVVARESTLVEVSLEEIRTAQFGQRHSIPDLAMDLLPIPAGTFQMGAASGIDRDERPVTRVTISQPYWLARTEVTQRQWEAVMGNNPSHFKGETLPVERVSWHEAMEFCRRLTERERAAGHLPEGYVYRLPTEAQWEYAGRAGTTADFGGTGRLDDMGWHSSNSGGSTKPVATKAANAWGLHDMHGNVWEWCLDWYADNLPGGSVIDPTGPTSGSLRVLRGGAWRHSARRCRSAYRGNWEPENRYDSVGFRVALSPSS
jgi:formylglycine-generating enzyme required for sulfatase activity